MLELKPNDRKKKFMHTVYDADGNMYPYVQVIYLMTDNNRHRNTFKYG